MARSDFERDFRDLHGPDVFDLDGDGSSYRVVTPPPMRHSAGARILAGMALIPILIMAFLLIVVGLGALGLLAIILKAMFHTVFG